MAKKKLNAKSLLKRGRGKKKSRRFKTSDLLSTGSTLLNLQCSDNPFGAYYKGGYFNFVGDSDSGKTIFAMSALAEASISPNFEDYQLIFDNAEGGALMDLESFFGRSLANRVSEPPRGISSSVEEFYYNLDDLYESETPFIYILDSMDVLEAEQEMEKFRKQKKASTEGREIAGSFGVAKAKLNSQGLRRARSLLQKTGSILIIISQTRDKISPMSFETKTRAGGHALKFYARLEIWSKFKGEITKTYRGKKRQIGIISSLKVKKNHITGKKGTIDVPIFHSFGIDDVGSCVDYLIDEKHWSKSGQKVSAKDFDFSGTRESLISYIQDNDLEDELRKLVGNVWTDISEACKVKRKNRYTGEDND